MANPFDVKMDEKFQQFHKDYINNVSQAAAAKRRNRKRIGRPDDPPTVQPPPLKVKDSLTNMGGKPIPPRVTRAPVPVPSSNTKVATVTTATVTGTTYSVTGTSVLKTVSSIPKPVSSSSTLGSPALMLSPIASTSKPKASTATGTVKPQIKEENKQIELDPDNAPPYDKIKSIKMVTKEVDIMLANPNPITYHKTSNYDSTLTENASYWHAVLVSQASDQSHVPQPININTDPVTQSSSPVRQIRNQNSTAETEYSGTAGPNNSIPGPLNLAIDTSDLTQNINQLNHPTEPKNTEICLNSANNPLTFIDPDPLTYISIEYSPVSMSVPVHTSSSEFNQTPSFPQFYSSDSQIPINPNNESYRIGIIPHDYPDRVLSIEENHNLQQAILNGILCAHPVRPRFNNYDTRYGFLLLDCADDCTEKWVRKTMSNLRTSAGRSLEVLDALKVPSYKLCALFPVNHSDSLNDIITFIQAQNHGLDTDAWRILQKVNEAKGVLLFFAVNLSSYLCLKSMGFEIFFKFTKVQIFAERKRKDKIGSLIHQPKRHYRKEDILEALFNVISDSEFIPVAYRKSTDHHYFFLRQSRPALGKLFKNGLHIKMFDNEFIYLTVKINVAHFTLGQMHPTTKMLKTCMLAFSELITLEGVPKVLNLDNLSENPEFIDMVVNLSNKATFELLSLSLNKSKELFSSIKGIRLSNNKIKNLSALEELSRISLQLLDLRNNNIADVNQLRHLDKITFTELYVEGNPFTKKPGYQTIIQEIFPMLTKLDDKILSEKTLKSNTPTTMIASDIPIELQFLGDVIKADDPATLSIFFKKYKQSDMWHQVLIHHNGKYSKHQLTSALMNQLTGHEFYPTYYRTGNEMDTFFIRNCFDQMEVLFNAKLIITQPEMPVKLTFKMNVANFKSNQIDASDRMSKAIGGCFQLMDKTYNLEEFSEREELKDVEVSLANPRTITHVLLQGARRFLGNIEIIKLGNNGIRSARGMHPLNWMKSLKAIHLNNNQIEGFSDLEIIPKIPVTEVWLDGNPLCKLDMSANEYVGKVKKIFPDIVHLDGENLSLEGSSIIQKNYLCSPDGYDLVEQFVNHYFSTYDSVGRQHMKGLYTDTAMLTASSNFTGISRSNEKQIKSYINISRNCLKMMPNYYSKVYYGAEEISQLHKSLPASEHDFRSFSIDLLKYSPTSAVITVNGMFKEIDGTLNEELLILGFVRTFILKMTATQLGMFGRNCEFKITNEQLMLYRPSIAQARSAFKIQFLEPEIEITEDDKEGLTIIFQELTSLVPSWCIRCLKESDWHFKNALELFVHLCSENKLPDHAFKFSKL